MIYLIDNTIDGQGPSPREIKAVIEKLRPDLPIVLEHFTKTSLRRVNELSPSHIVLSGQSHPWTMYSDELLAGVFEVIHEVEQPVFGICGGHQQIALAYGSKVGLMKRLTPGEGYDGALRERGFLDVEILGNGIFSNLPREVTVWHSHCDEVKELPEGFSVTASNQTCRLQAMQHNSRRVFSVQFHPELFDDEHPQGRRIVENFLDL